jgi:hypothetical protein
MRRRPDKERVQAGCSFCRSYTEQPFFIWILHVSAPICVVRPHIAAGINEWRSGHVHDGPLAWEDRPNTKSRCRQKPCALVGCSAPFVLMSITVNALIVVADSPARKRSSASDDCSANTDKAERLTCFDNLARRPAPHPFKGANAPALSGSL